jgi:alpha-L-arabinofuranosidase
VEGWQWKPDLIWFDNLKSVKSVNYYIQQIYGSNKGTRVLKTLAGKEALTGQNGLYASSVIDDVKKEIILKIANTSTEKKDIRYLLTGLKNAERNVTYTVLKSNDPDMENTLINPQAVIPSTSNFKISSNELKLVLEPMTFNMYVIKL